jgi:hypothetical protein
MLTTVLRDKAKIEETIIELDRYKRDALHKTWEKVNGWVLKWIYKISSPAEVVSDAVTSGTSLQSFFRATLQSFNLQKIES